MLTLGSNKGEVLCILGHNGAGKTTMIKCLTGLIEPSFGDAFIFNKSIVSEIDDVRKISGVCPQHDIIWPELTAIEHLRFFCNLKGIPRSRIESEIVKQLKLVKLSDVGHHKVSTFSGGMKVSF